MTKKPAKVPLVSVIIPVWNTASNLKELIKGLFQQTYQNLEIIAIDDGSSDDSLHILNELAKKDKRLRVEHQKNAGVSVARNRGIDLATGEYLVFVDSDDNVLPEFVATMVQAMRNNSKAMLAVMGRENRQLRENKVNQLYMEPRRARQSHEPLSNYVAYLMILDGRMYGMTGRIFIADIIRKHKIRLEAGRDFAEDTKFMIDYLSAKDGEIIFIPKPLYIYNFGTETSIVRKSSLKWQNWQKSYKDLKEWIRRDGKGRISLRARILLSLIYSRWRIAHIRSIRRAKK